jgi:hypothetical protein
MGIPFPYVAGRISTDRSETGSTNDSNSSSTPPRSATGNPAFGSGIPAGRNSLDLEAAGPRQNLHLPAGRLEPEPTPRGNRSGTAVMDNTGFLANHFSDNAAAQQTFPLSNGIAVHPTPAAPASAVQASTSYQALAGWRPTSVESSSSRPLPAGSAPGFSNALGMATARAEFQTQAPSRLLARLTALSNQIARTMEQIARFVTGRR